MVVRLPSTLELMKCPVCSSRVADSAKECASCGSSFTDGEWAPVPDAPAGPLTNLQVVGLGVGAVVAAVLATGLTVLILSPPVSGDAGHISLFWLVLFLGVLAEGGRTIFGAYVVAAFAGIFVYVRRRRAQ